MKKAVVVVLAAALAVSVLALAGCGGNGGDSSTPEQVVEKFMQATLAEDADTVYSMISEESKAGVADKQDLVEGSADAIAGYELGTASISGDTARVPTSIEMKQADYTLEFEVALVKEGGSWKIDLAETGASMDEAFQKFMEEYETQE